MSGRSHVAARRHRFAPRRHQLAEGPRPGEVCSISFRVAGANSDEAIAAAKVEAKAEGWILRTVSGARAATDTGLWVVTLAAVRA